MEAGRFLDLGNRGARLPRMTDAERQWQRMVRHLQEFERRSRESARRPEPVLPPDLDVDAELDRCFAEPGVSLRVSVV
jgi:hypothetical protein